MKKGNIVLTHRFENKIKKDVFYLIVSVLEKRFIVNRIDFNENDQTYQINKEPIQKIDFKPGVVLSEDAVNSIKSLKNIVQNFKNGENENETT